MFARISTILGKPDRTDEGIRNYREQVLPAVRKMAGFKGAYLLVDRKIGKSAGITMWETEKDLQASSAAANQLRARGAVATAAATPPMVEIYEVAVQSQP